jgi:hypothetical protein
MERKRVTPFSVSIPMVLPHRLEGFRTGCLFVKKVWGLGITVGDEMGNDLLAHEVALTPALAERAGSPISQQSKSSIGAFIVISVMRSGEDRAIDGRLLYQAFNCNAARIMGGSGKVRKEGD